MRSHLALNIKIIKRDTVGEVRLIGKMDSIAAAEAEKALLSVADRFDHIVLDLAELQYITSAGLRVLKSLYLAVRRRGGSLSCVNVNKMVMEVFEVTGFVSMLQLS